jgi:hypothetical protein
MRMNVTGHTQIQWNINKVVEKVNILDEWHKIYQY